MDNKIRAITYGTYDGFLIWHQPNGGGCTAMLTNPSDQNIMKNVLQNLDRNNWQLKVG
jgi:hypothetical protein